MPKVRILYVVTKLELGGAQKQLLTLINHLDQAKFQPFLFTAKEGLLLQEAVSINGLTVKKSKWLERSINPIKDFLALVEAYFFIKKNNIDFVHTHSSKAGILGRIAARLAKVRIILHTVHGWSFNDYQPKIKRGIFIFLERFCAGFTHKIIVVSRHDKVKGLTHRIGEDKKYNLIRYGIDYEEFKITKGRDFKKELGINSDCLVVGMVSCFKPQKSPHDFIRAASLVHQVMPEVKFILAGDGVLRRDIEELISKFQLKDSIILPGWRRDIPDMLSALDVFILTSLWEGLPIAALEAMSASRAVIATNTGG
ncbi:MAG: glycosyltransferase family 4 protein, partial [Candidatus Omnitrophica bacterium]|nr:glycosyltransferase family 4 protein [Candidatus Omnitrophota bacterium]